MEPIELQKKLLDAINDEIGEDAEVKEGRPRRLSETGEEYVEFACRFREEDCPRVLEIFTRAVKGYKNSARLVFNSDGRIRGINDNGKFKVYWRNKPEIVAYNKAKADALMKVDMTFGGSKRNEAEQEVRRQFANAKDEDYTFYTRFLFTYQEKRG